MTREDLHNAIYDWAKADEKNRIAFAVLVDKNETNGYGITAPNSHVAVAKSITTGLLAIRSVDTCSSVFDGATTALIELMGADRTAHALREVAEEIERQAKSASSEADEK